MTTWYRSYCETLNDPKIQTLPLEAFKAWHNALYLACKMSSHDGNIGTLQAIAFMFRETPESVSSAFHPLIKAGLIVTAGETFQIASWKKRQFKSDSSTERVKRFRKRSRNVPETVPDTDTDTDIPIDKSIGQSADFQQPEDPAPDPRKSVFNSGIRLLGQAGYNPKQARSLIGLWLKDHGDGEVLSALGKAQREGAIEPVEFIQGIFRHKRQREPEGKYVGVSPGGAAYLP